MRDFSLYCQNNLLKSPYDPRDYKLSQEIPLESGNLPDEFESPMASFVYDQGSSSMCCACAYSMLRYLQESDEENGGSGLDEPLSPAFTYANRLPGEDFEGMFLRSCCKKAVEDGSVLYSVFPGFMSYPAAKKYFLQHKSELLTLAKPFAITSYYQCDRREVMQAAIMSTKAVLGGVPIYQCMYDIRGDVIKYDPNKNTRDFGGHAVLFTGWKTIQGKFHWQIQNSWGADWGDNGRAWIPEDYPWIETPYAIVDGNVELVFEDYKKQYCK